MLHNHGLETGIKDRLCKLLQQEPHGSHCDPEAMGRRKKDAQGVGQPGKGTCVPCELDVVA